MPHRTGIPRQEAFCSFLSFSIMFSTGQPESEPHSCLQLSNIPLCGQTCFPQPFVTWWTLGWFHFCLWCCHEQSHLLVWRHLQFSWGYPGVELPGAV
jgi:hypothetical protein